MDGKKALLETVGVGTPFLCSLATVGEDGGPAVRFVRAKADADGTLRVPTFVETGKVSQIRADARVHVTCGDTDAEHPGTYFQIAGTAEVTTDPAEREAAWTPRLEKWFSGRADESYAVVTIRPHLIVALPIGRTGEPLFWRAESA